MLNDEQPAQIELNDVAGDASPEDMVDVALSTVRNHLGMEIAYLSEFVDGRSIFRAVSAPGLEHLIKPGDWYSLDDVYCQHILDGRLPNVIPDTSKEPICRDLPITSQAPIGSHVSVPVHREDGTVYGMFCCLSPAANPTLNQRDLRVMETFAGLAKKPLHASLRARAQRAESLARIDTALKNKDFQIVLQPIFPIGQSVPYGFEALCRFQGDPYRPPNEWFDEALHVGKQIDLELAVISVALEALKALPDTVSLSLNLSPATIVSPELTQTLAGFPLERIVLEITEHAMVEDYETLERELRQLEMHGVRFAIDDVGAGYSGLSHILKTRPHVLKLDLALTRDVDTDLARQSLVKAMVHFADLTNAKIVAEGIETENELAMLQSLGVHLGQGYFLGRPAPLEAALQWFAQAEAAKNLKAG